MGVIVKADLSGYDYHPGYPAFEEYPQMEHLDISEEEKVPLAPIEDIIETTPESIEITTIDEHIGVTEDEHIGVTEDEHIEVTEADQDIKSTTTEDEHIGVTEDDNPEKEGQSKVLHEDEKDSHRHIDTSESPEDKSRVLDNIFEKEKTDKKKISDNEILKEDDSPKTKSPEIASRMSEEEITPKPSCKSDLEIITTPSPEIPEKEKVNSRNNEINEIPGHELTDTGYVYRDPRNRY